MRYKYTFKAYFLCKLFNSAQLTTDVTAAETMFNSLPRKKGNGKQISVVINAQNKCLDFELESDVALKPINFLRASQYFSKALSLQPGMSNYIMGRRLLVQ